MNNKQRLYTFYLLMGVTMLACRLTAKPTPLPPLPTVDQLSYDIQTATATIAAFSNLPTYTPTPVTPTATPLPVTPTSELTETTIITTSNEEATATPTIAATDKPAEATPPTHTPAPRPTNTPEPTATAALSPPLMGGEWDFEAGFTPWANPFGDSCPVGELAVGWSGFTTRDQFGSSCLNKNEYPANVKTGKNVQEITFAFIGNEAGIYKTIMTIPTHRYRIEGYVKRESSSSPVETALGIDFNGGGNWQDGAVKWFPWREEANDAWAKTSETVTATSASMTIFIKGHHPQAVGGGALRIDNISVTDIGPE